MVVVYWIRSFLVSIVLGLLWYDTSATDVQAKMMLATTGYVYIVGCLVDLFEGTHRRQTDYLRERLFYRNNHNKSLKFPIFIFYVSTNYFSLFRASVAQTAQAYWWSDGTPVLLHSIVNALVFSAPLYLLAGLRKKNGKN